MKKSRKERRRQEEEEAKAADKKVVKGSVEYWNQIRESMGMKKLQQ